MAVHGVETGWQETGGMKGMSMGRRCSQWAVG